MLSAAAAALLAAPALADTTITKVETTTQKTSATGNLTINSGGGISFKSATVPLLEIDSSNTVNNGGVLTETDQGTATAVQIDANGFTGSFLGNGQITLTGTGTQKTALYLKGTSTFTGNIMLDTGSVIAIAGDQSTGILTDATSTLNGDLTLGGTLQMAPSTANSTSATTITIANLLGVINGNVIISSGASYSAIGNGAQGFVIGVGGIHACAAATPGCAGEIGSFVNSGTLAVGGVSTRATSGKNAESGSALVVNGSIDGGILNNGPTAPGDSTTAASITGNGVSPVVLISSSLTPLTIGIDTADAANGAGGCLTSLGATIGCSFINRGSILAAPVDPNENARTILIGGTTTAPITFTGGFFSSGAISAQATSIEPGTAVSATALEIDPNVNIPEIHVSGQTSTTSGNGSISAAIAGPQGGSAVAIFLADDTTGATSVPLITVERGARVVSNATVTDASVNGVKLVSIAIEDDSGSVTTIHNMGTIAATATPLTNGNTAQTTALFLQKNATGVDVENSGTITGDIIFGAGTDTYHVFGSAVNGAATHTSGTIDFGASIGGPAVDTLHIGTLGNVAGTILSEGDLNVTVDGTGVLTVQNVGSTMATHDLSVAGGSANTAGTINITVSQNVGVPVITSSDMVTFGSGALLNVKYGSFITTGGSFILIQAPTGNLGIAQTDVDRYNAAIGSTTTLPFLFQSAGITKVLDDGAGHSNLVLSVVPKTSAQLGLTGYGAALFPFANTALTNDPVLGAAFVAGVNSQADAQKAYDAFAPDLSGGSRALAISLTDQGTGVVAARQRTLRMFGKEAGDLTLWGNEFAEYITNKGGTVGVNPTYLNSGAAPGFKDHGFGFSVGIDAGSAQGGWYGAAFSFYSGDITEGGDRQARSSTLWYMFTGYSDWRGRGLFVDSQLNLGIGDFKSKRFISLTDPATNSVFSREADSKHASLLASIGVTTGVMMRYSGLTVMPQISLDGMTLREEGYTEIGGGNGFNLTVKPSYSNSLRIFLGSEFRGDLNLGDFLLQPAARIGYRYDLLNDPAKLKAQFADLNPNLTGAQPGSQFTLQGPDPSRGNVVAGAALNATTENWTIGLNFDYVRGDHNETEEVGTLSLLGRI